MKQRFGTGPEGQEKQNPEIPRDVFKHIINMLPVPERVKLRKVSQSWKEDIDSDVFWRKAGAKSYQDFVNRIRQFNRSGNMNELKQMLKERVMSGEYTLSLAERIYTFWTLGTVEERIMNLPEEMQAQCLNSYSTYMRVTIANAYGIMMLLEETITLDDVAYIPGHVLKFCFNNRIPREALRRGLISFNDVQVVEEKMYTIFSSEKIYDALGKEWFPLQKVAKCSDELLDLLFPQWDEESFLWNMLSEDILSLKDMRRIPLDILRLIDCERGYNYLKNKKLNYDLLRKLSEADLEHLLSDMGEIALVEERFFAEDVFKMHQNMLNHLLNDIGMTITNPQNPLLTAKQIKNIPSPQHAQLLFSACGLTALSEGLINFEIARWMTWQRLEIFLSEEGISTLQKGYFDIRELDHLKDREAIRYIVSGAGDRLFQYQFINILDHINSSADEFREIVESMNAAVSSLFDYVNVLCSLNLDLPSIINNNVARRDKGITMRNMFFAEDSHGGDVDIAAILSDADNLLIQNSSKLPFKFFKVKSLVKGYRNPHLENRLCESKTEWELVQLQAAKAA